MITETVKADKNAPGSRGGVGYMTKCGVVVADSKYVTGYWADVKCLPCHRALINEHPEWAGRWPQTGAS